MIVLMIKMALFSLMSVFCQLWREVCLWGTYLHDIHIVCLFPADGVALGAAAASAQVSVQVVVFFAVILHKVRLLIFLDYHCWVILYWIAHTVKHLQGHGFDSHGMINWYNFCKASIAKHDPPPDTETESKTRAYKKRKMQYVSQ